MRSKKRYKEKNVDSTAVRQEREVQMDKWLFVGVADSALRLQV